MKLPFLFTFALAASLSGEEFTAPQRAFLDKQCFDCHDAQEKKGGLDLSALKLDLADEKTFAEWVKVHDRVRDGEMPPKKKARPPEVESKALLAFLDTNLRAANAAAQAREGRALARRMNREEYQNTLRDLFGVEVDYLSRLPADEMALGFDKVGSALSVSAEHLQVYLATARAALDEVIASGPPPQVLKAEYPQRHDISTERPDTFIKRSKFMGCKPDAVVRFGDYLDGILGFRHVDVEGTYRFRVHARAWGSEEPVKARIKAGGPRQADVAWVLAYPEFPKESTVVEVTSYMYPGDTLRVTPIGIAGPGAQHRVKYEEGHNAQNYMGPGLAIESVEVEGPLRESWPKPGHQRWFGELDFAKATRGDAERVLRGFLPRAFRRPVSDDEVRHYLAIHDTAAKSADFLACIKVALQAALCSPHFLFLHAPAGPLDDHALAARLSYFLWNSTPDDELNALAAKGALREPQTLHAQVERMLKDKKAAAFTESFTGQWLDLRKIQATTPDELLYPEWDELLEWSCVEETRRFFDEVLANDLSIANFVQSDFAMLNDRLAAHYGIPGVKGIALRKVAVPKDSVRGGVLTQASVLKVTANGTTSSPVVRGAWVMDRILGQPAPPPPQGVPAVEPDIRGATTIREQLAKHRSDTSCAVCHARIDPPGFALESFDVIGGWRDRYRAAGDNIKEHAQIVRPLTFDFREFQHDETKRGPMKATVGLGPAVDASSELPDGRAFHDYLAFRAALLADKDQLARALTTKLVTYATGSGPEYADRAVIEQIVTRVRSRDYGLRSLIQEVVSSPLFLKQ